MQQQTQTQNIALQCIHLLDLDGTLVNSASIDNLCFWRAISEVFECPEEIREPGEFNHVTDTGILQQWCRENYGQPPDKGQIQAVKSAFIRHLQQSYNQVPAEFTAIKGAREYLGWLLQQPGQALAIATGGWQLSAHFKLQKAGLDTLGLPVASSDDAVSRIAILRHARRKARCQLNTAGLQDIVCYGDALWDLTASRNLGARFIGIASGDAARQLTDAGAERVVPDYTGLMV